MQAGVVFDVDDTLYLESDYVRSGFRAVSRVLAGTGVVSYEEAVAFLEGCFDRGVRNNTFDLLLQEMPRLAAELSVQSLVEAYRLHAPEIRLLPGMCDLLETLRVRGARLGIISDGFLESQRNKVASLELDAIVDETVLTDRWGREFWKPHPRAFEHLTDKWAIPPSRMVYVGDNPDKDFVAPNRLDWWSIRLRHPGQLRIEHEPPTENHGPKVTVSSVAELERSLLAWIGEPLLG